jgi:UDP-2-acetamido-3-amino-2,3-dideoxy-glucuronate N-acetyltransferase
MTVLLVGLGRWGEKHLRVLRELGVDLWVADPDPARRRWAVEQGLPAARAVADYRMVLDRVDAVDVVTPADSHAAIAAAALAAGRHCFVEKPLAMTAAEGIRLAVLAREAGRLLQVGHILRFHPVTDTVRAALAGGRIGPVRFALARFAGFKRPRTDVGITHTDGVHFFDLFAFLLGQPATRVTAVQRDFLGRGLDDMAVTVVEYGPVTTVVETDYFVPGTWRHCVLVGEGGSLVADYAAGTVLLHRGEHRHGVRAWEAVDGGTEALAIRPGDALRLELEAFRDACAGRRPVAVTAEDGVRTLEIVEAAARSALEGQAVKL